MAGDAVFDLKCPSVRAPEMNQHGETDVGILHSFLFYPGCRVETDIPPPFTVDGWKNSSQLIKLTMQESTYFKLPFLPLTNVFSAMI